MAAKEKQSFGALKAAIGQIDLQKLLRPHFLELLEQTVNPIKLALILLKKDAMSIEEVEECTNESMILYQNLEIYRIIKKKNAGVELINALEQTGNIHILQLLQSSIDDSEIQQPFIGSTESSKPNITIDIPKMDVSHQNRAPLESPSELPATPSTADIAAAEDKLSIFTFEDPVPSAPILVSETLDEPCKIQPPEIPVQFSFLKARKFKETLRNPWNETIGVETLQIFGVDNIDTILAVVDSSKWFGKQPRKYFSPTNFHPDERCAIPTFIENQCQFDLEQEFNGLAVARPPHTMYINTRSFCSQQWTWLSKLLIYHCKNSLENLCLDEVNFSEYCKGTAWTISCPSGDRPGLRFSKLKLFVVKTPGGVGDVKQLVDLLAIIKSSSYPLNKLWNETSCRIQIWKGDSNSCQLLMDPASGTVLVDDVEDDVKKHIGSIVNQQEPYSSSLSGRRTTRPPTKMYFVDPHPNLLENEVDRHLLTHLFLMNWAQDGIHVIRLVMKSLSEFKALQKLGLRGGGGWKIDLTQLDVIENLSFLYLESAKVNCGEVGVNLFPWRPSVQKIILAFCDFKRKPLATKFPLIEHTFDSLIFTKIEPQGSRRPAKLNFFEVSKLSSKEAVTGMLKEFFN